MKTTNRAAIVFFFDKDGIVDDYFIYWLQCIKAVSAFVLVVVNGKITPDGRDKCEAIANEVITRENIGYDGWAYKTAIEHIGYDRIIEYDELLLTNYTLYGPFTSLQNVFDAMQTSECDFWGMFRLQKGTGMQKRDGKNLVAGIPVTWNKSNAKPVSNFWVLRKKVICSKFFRAFYSKMLPINTYDESTALYEHRFAELAYKHGFVMDTYECEKDTRIPASFLRIADELISKESVPVLRRRNITLEPEDTLRYVYHSSARLSIEYIRQNTDYDLGLIWRNLARTAYQRDVYQTMQYDWIASKQASKQASKRC